MDDCYATFNIGYYFNDTQWHHPADPRTQPLAKVAADILGLDYTEIRPALLKRQATSDQITPYVCIATASTAQCKHWLHENGWQDVIDYLNTQGYGVMVVQKEDTSLSNIIDRTGDRPLTERIAQIDNAKMFIGLGSGLSWLAWALEKPVVLISGFSEPYTEFQSDCERVINTSVCNGCWNDTAYAFDRDDWNWCPRHKGTSRQFECSTTITSDMVIDAVNRVVTRLASSG